MMQSNWFVLGKGFGCEFQGQYLRWIYWSPGRTAQEGLLKWGEETNGVCPWEQGSPRHYFRSASVILTELIKAGIIDILKSRI